MFGMRKKKKTLELECFKKTKGLKTKNKNSERKARVPGMHAWKTARVV